MLRSGIVFGYVAVNVTARVIAMSSSDDLIWISKEGSDFWETASASSVLKMLLFAYLPSPLVLLYSFEVFGVDCGQSIELFFLDLFILQLCVRPWYRFRRFSRLER